MRILNSIYSIELVGNFALGFYGADQSHFTHFHKQLSRFDGFWPPLSLSAEQLRFAISCFLEHLSDRVFHTVTHWPLIGLFEHSEKDIYTLELMLLPLVKFTLFYNLVFNWVLLWEIVLWLQQKLQSSLIRSERHHSRCIVTKQHLWHCSRASHSSSLKRWQINSED